MIYELKQYTPHAGKSVALRERFVKSTMPIFSRVGVKVVAVFTPDESAGELWYITAFESAAARDAAWEAFSSDTEWKAVKAASETDGPLLASQKSTSLGRVAGTPAL
ncbi:NIPSNAP family protein [Hydrogenophaga laconesensis]|uniref:NIPSNAP domain-containing protein n=1 Tax=Hydrogenophaga laconesensis TaxID=1805971 RepID=A0ABU1V7J5_9BURK|nr:NIPSNAP family protein [Hydrogenophaga laconesensis]MDR7093223.1 hypothetical protein [Hydrogenophaga laconesensis]